MEFFSEKVETIKFTVLSPDDIRRMSVVSISSSELYENNLPKWFGLFDTKMGPYDKNYLCNTCKQSYMKCPGHFGHIDLVEPVYNIHYMNILKKLLGCVCYTCSNLLFDKTNESKLKLLMKKRGQKKFQYIFTNLLKNCMHCSRTQPKFTKEGMYMYVVLSSKQKNKDSKIKLYAKKCLEILKRISEEDQKLLGFKDNKPEWLICQVLPVPPPCIRPSVKHSINLRSEDDLTYKLLDIIKANNQLAQKYKKNDMKHIHDYVEYLQYHVTTLIDNDIRGVPPAQHRSGRVLKAYKQRIKGKEGRIRGNLMGKRVNFSGRSVISPDPYLRIDEIGVPMKMAKILIMKEMVNKHNIERLQKYVDNGPEIFPGAKYLINNGIMKDLTYLRPSDKVLEIGMEVGRHLMDGDIVLFNRQPSLHKMSMMSHIVKIIPTKSFRFNPNVCNPYNADFDGDEMNVFIPISTYTQVELRKMVHVPTQIITPQANKPVIGAIMDTIVGASHITMDGIKITHGEMIDIMGNIDSYEGDFDLEPIEEINGEKYYSGRDVMSMILPNINYQKNAEKKEDIVQIHKGKWINGMAKKDVIGAASGSLIHIIANDMGVYAAAKFLNEIQRVANTHLLNTGFSVSLGDCISTKNERNYIHSILSKARAEVRTFINMTHARAKSSKTIQLRDEYENKIFGTLNKARDDAGKFAKEKLGKMNGLNFMVNIGSKGNYINICQIMSCVGQQSIADKMKQGRVPFGLEFRTIPHFQKFDDGPESRGFISKSYLEGLKPHEFFFHHMAGREGLIDTAVKSVVGDTRLVIIENGKPRNIEIGNWIDSYMKNYKDEVIYYDEKDANMELINISKLGNKVFIPTTDNYGNMSWELITNITRHDPSEYIYEIKTKSGRNVKVVESKSLLIWNNSDKKYEPMDMKDVKIGDKVPISINLINNLTEIKFINMENYLPKNEYIYGKDFNVAKDMVINILENRKKMPANWWSNNNNREFTLPYDKSQIFLRTLKRSNISYIKNDKIYPYKAKRNNTIIEDKFELNEENGFFIGLYIAEGSSHIKSGKVCIANNDEKILKKVRNWFDKRNIIHKTYIKSNSESLSTTIQGYSTILAKFVSRFVGAGAGNKFIPAEFYLASNDFIKGFIDGYYSGDGTISKNSIDVSSASRNIIEGISMLLTRFGIYSRMSVTILKSNNFNTEKMYPVNRLSIRSKYAKIFAETFNLTIEYKNEKLEKIKNSKTLLKHWNMYEPVNDTILDEIISIEKISNDKYPKVYDLTIPKTKNFGLANGLQVYDTSETGYIQRRLIKAMEDVKIAYDCTVRNETNTIIQFVYGTNGFDAKSMERQHISFIMGANVEFEKKFKWKRMDYKNLNKVVLEEIKKVKGHTKILDDEYHLLMRIKNYFQEMIDEDFIYLPINIRRIIQQSRKKFGLNKNTKNDINPIEIIERVNKLLRELKIIYDTHRLSLLLNQECLKRVKYNIRCHLSSKKLLLRDKINREAFEWILKKIEERFYKSVIHPGEMVGPIAAQSIGERTTQLSVTPDTEVRVLEMNQYNTPKIGDLVDRYMKRFGSIKTHITEDGRVSHILPIKKEWNIMVPGLNYKTQKVEWKRVTEFSKHPPNGKLVRIKTKSGKTVTATLSHSFVSRNMQGKPYTIRGDELRIGMMVPIIK